MSEPTTASVDSAPVREGSSTYYALLRTPPAQRLAVISLLRLCNSLASTLHDVQEPTVIEKKIHWWHEEIDRLYQGAARHPDTRAATDAITRHDIEPVWLSAVLEANNNEKYLNAADDLAFDERLRKDYGSRTRAVLNVLQPGFDVPADGWALGFGTFDRLRLWSRLHHRGYPVLPDSDYACAGLSPEQLGDRTRDAADIGRLLSPRIEKAIHHLTTATREDAPRLALAALPLLIHGQLRVQQLRQWQRHPERLANAYLTLTPLKKAWYSWRVTRRFRTSLQRVDVRNCR